MARQLEKANVFVIPHEVDFEVFKPTEREQAGTALGLRQDSKYLLFAANPGMPVKRFPLARAAADLLARQDPSIELLVVYKEPQERLALYLSACDVLARPTRKVHQTSESKPWLATSPLLRPTWAIFVR